MCVAGYFDHPMPMMSTRKADANPTSVPVWDTWVRLFHWSLATAVLFQILSAQTGWQFFDLHRLVGEIALALVVFRLLWGFLGSSNARLGRLFNSPVHALSHLRDVASRRDIPERGHNAAGGWAIVAMLLLIGIQAGTGLFIADEDEFIEGALYGSVNSSLSGLMYEVHEINAKLLQILVLVHVIMVFVYLIWLRRNLITPMFTGLMRWPEGLNLPSLRFAPWWLGLLLAGVITASFAWLLEWF